MIYIKKSIKGFYLETEGLIDPLYYEGQIGLTYEDFLEDKWILLSNNLVIFHLENPEASISEVLAMELDPVIVPNQLEIVRKNKLNALSNYDSGSAVNDFTVNGLLHAWFTPLMRSDYRNSIEAAELTGIESLSLFIGDNLITIPTQSAKLMLALILLYANLCFIVTQQHKNAIQALNSIESINNYDYTVGYPTKLNFVL